MAETTIEWTATRRADGTSAPGFTFNPWRGCTRVSAGCVNCYAETLSGRNHGTLGTWGPKGERVIAAETYWRLPLKWEKEARAAGERRRVFCASLADVFEGPETMPQASRAPVEAARRELWKMIGLTPNLDWILLTKRPENVLRMVPHEWYLPMYHGEFPANVWIGTSVEDQATANERIPHLLKIPASVRFLSCEPLLGPVELTWEDDAGRLGSYLPMHDHRPEYFPSVFGDGSGKATPLNVGVDWVIVGGESGPGARPMHPEWARSLRDQCEAAGVPFFFKQHGEWAAESQMSTAVLAEAAAKVHRAGTGLQSIHEWGGDVMSWRVGKKAAGRLLDGKLHDAFPEPGR